MHYLLYSHSIHLMSKLASNITGIMQKMSDEINDDICISHGYGLCNQLTDIVTSDSMEVSLIDFDDDMAKMKQRFFTEYSELLKKTNRMIGGIKIGFDAKLKKRTEDLVHLYQERMNNMETYWRDLLHDSIDEKDQHHMNVMTKLSHHLQHLKTTFTNEFDALKEEYKANLCDEQTKLNALRSQLRLSRQQNDQLTVTLRNQKESFEERSDSKTVELTHATDDVVKYKNAMKRIRTRLDTIHDEQKVELQAKDDEIVELKKKLKCFQQDVVTSVQKANKQQTIEYQTKINKMEMEFNIAITNVNTIQDVMGVQQQKHQHTLHKLKDKIILYKSRNQELKLRLDFLEKSMNDLSELYPQSYSNKALNTSKQCIKNGDYLENAQNNSTLLQEVNRLRKSIRSKEMELFNQKTNNSLLNQKLQLTQDIGNNYKEELKVFMNKTTTYVEQQL
eukprot:993400_1